MPFTVTLSDHEMELLHNALAAYLERLQQKLNDYDSITDLSTELLTGAAYDAAKLRNRLVQLVGKVMEGHVYKQEAYCGGCGVRGMLVLKVVAEPYYPDPVLVIVRHEGTHRQSCPQAPIASGEVNDEPRKATDAEAWERAQFETKTGKNWGSEEVNDEPATN